MCFFQRCRRSAPWTCYVPAFLRSPRSTKLWDLSVGMCMFPHPTLQRSSSPGGLEFINLDDPDAHRRVFATTLHLAAYPSVQRLASAKIFLGNTHRGDCTWISQQLRDFVADASWANVAQINKMGTAYDRVLRRIGRFMSPLHLTPSVG